MIKTKYCVLLLLVCAIPLFFLNVHDLHGWGDDFSHYILEAQNIAHGKPYYLTSFIYNDLNIEYAPPQYPVGYPLLLSPIIAIWGIAIKPMLYFNAVLVTALLFALFYYFRKHTNNLTAILLSLIIVYSNFILDLKGNVLSDLPCLLFVTFYLVLRNATTFPKWRLVLLILTVVMATLIRTQGILLVAAECLYLLFWFVKNLRSRQEKVKQFYHHPSFIIIASSLALYLFLDKVVFAAPVTTASFYYKVTTSATGSFMHLLHVNFNYLITLFLEFPFYPNANPGLQKMVIVVQYAVFSAALLGFFISLRNGLKLDDCFFLFMCLFILLFPPHQGIRYLIEVVPVYILYSFLGLRFIRSKFIRLRTKPFAIAVTIFYLFLGFNAFSKYSRNECEGCIPNSRDLVLINYLKTHLTDNDVTVFWKPRVMALYTGKKFTIISWQISTRENTEQFKKLGVDYILAGFDENRYIANYLKESNAAVDSQVIVDDFVLYKVNLQKK